MGGWGTLFKVGCALGRRPLSLFTAGYLGFTGTKSLITGQGIMSQTKDLFFGKEDSSNRSSAITALVESPSGQASESSEIGGLNEVPALISNIFGGGSGNNSLLQMIQNFGSNLFSGKMSGMSMAGLVLSGLLIFGRGGLLGKIAGALLAMMIVAMNSDNKVQQQTGGRAVRPAQEANRAAGLDADTIQTQMQSNYEKAASGAEQAVEMNQHRG